MASIYTFGNLTVCGQALAVLITGIVLFVAMIAIKPSASMFLAASVMFLVVCVNAYVVNCMVVGKCEIFAWVLSVVYVLNFGLAAVGLLMSGKLPADKIRQIETIESLPKKALKSLSRRK